MFQVNEERNGVSIRMSADLKNIDKAGLETKKMLAAAGMTEHVFEMLLVMREALTNAVIHGSKSDPSKEIRYEAKVDEGELVLVVEDQGPGFDWKFRSLDVPGPESLGGRGLAIMSEYFHIMKFNDIGNKVTLRKRTGKEDGMTEIRRDGCSAVVAPGRDVVASMADEMRGELKQLVDDGVNNITLDLSDATMMDSIGMGLLIALHNSLKKKQGTLHVVNVNEDILGLLRTMRLDKHFEIKGA